MNKIWLAVGIFLYVTGCTSGPVPIEYYLLNAPPGAEPAASVSCDQSQPMLIESVELSSFLRQPGLVLQRGPNKVVVSNTHLWAENLDNALPKALMKDLQQLSGGCRYYLKGHDWVSGEHYRLFLRVDNLQATTAGEVITSGRFQIVDSTGQQPPTMKEFSFSRDLVEDGYTHAVVQLELLVRQIAASILQASEEPISPGKNL